MFHVPDEELEALLNDLESYRVERKESWKGSAPDSAREAVCAFANDLAGKRELGCLIIGARDDGSPTGLAVSDELLRTLADIRTDGNILPLPSLLVEKRIVKGAEIAVVIVAPADSPPVRYKGRIYVRSGPRKTLASAQDESILNEKRRYRDVPFDVQPVPSADITALSRVLFEQDYLTKAIAPDVIAANERTYEQRLAACRMIASANDPVPTILGILTLGLSPRDWLPGAYVQFLRFSGTSTDAAIIDDASIDGPLGQMLRRMDEKLEAHNRSEVDIRSSDLETRKATYPRVAIQQLIRNAIMHRTYEATNAPVRVNWFDDRIEITSPGGPYGIVNQQNFGQNNNDYRNPNLAEAMKVLGYVQRFGVGIQLARSELKRFGMPDLLFEVKDTLVHVTLRRHE